MPWPLHLFILCKLQGHDLTLTSWPVCVGCGWGTGLDWFEVVNTGSVLFLCDPEKVKRKLTTWKKLLHTHCLILHITYCLVHQSFDNFTIIQSRSTLMFISITLHILLRKNMRYPFLIRKEKNVHKYNHGQ